MAWIVDDVLDDILRVARRCERAAKTFEEEPLASMRDRIMESIEQVELAWSGGWLGYHANVYTQNLRPRQPGEYFDLEWGAHDGFDNRTRGNWAEYDYKYVINEILRRAQVKDTQPIEKAADEAQRIFKEARRELLPTIDAILETYRDDPIKEVRSKIVKIEPIFHEKDLAQALIAGRQFATRDARAHAEGIRVPPHIKLRVWVASQLSSKRSLENLAEHSRYLVQYLEKRRKMKGKSVARKDGKIFVGHGRSLLWRELQDFIEKRLGLVVDEFNREPTAGLSHKERLETMLDESVFAFIVMTAEDEQADKVMRARQNVVHEAGLFQGRHGFERCIVLLESGCEEFSNIHGIGQLRFPKGQISAIFEDVRRVLERERII